MILQVCITSVTKTFQSPALQTPFIYDVKVYESMNKAFQVPTIENTGLSQKMLTWQGTVRTFKSDFSTVSNMAFFLLTYMLHNILMYP